MLRCKSTPIPAPDLPGEAREKGKYQMSAYVIATAKVRDEARFAEFVKRVPEAVARHGGKYLVRGGNVEQVGGDWAPGRVVVMRFDSLERARTFLDSPELSGIKDMRDQSADVKAILVEGL